MCHRFALVATYLNTVERILLVVKPAGTLQALHMEAVAVEASYRSCSFAAGTAWLGDIHASPISSYKLIAVFLPIYLERLQWSILGRRTRKFKRVPNRHW